MNAWGGWPGAADVALLVPLLVSLTAAFVLGVAEWRASRPALLRPLLALAPLLILGAFLRFHPIEAKTPWQDEGLTAVRTAGFRTDQVVAQARRGGWVSDLRRFSRPAPGTLARFLLHPAAHNADVHPPLYFMLARVWLEAVPGAFGALRPLSAILGVLAIAAAAWLTLEASGSRAAALLAGALLAVSPLQVLYSQEARMYTLVVLLTLASTAALVRFLRAGGPGRAGLYAALLGLGCLTHGLFVLVVAGHAFYLATLWRGPSRNRAVQGLCAALGIALTTALPWIWIAYERGREKRLEWLMEPMAVTTWGRRVVAILALNVGDHMPLRPAPALVAVVGLVLLAELGRRRMAWGDALAMPTAFYLLALACLDGLRGSTFAAEPRYLLVPASLLLALAGAGLFDLATRWRWLSRVTVGVALGAMALAAHRVAAAPEHWIKPSGVPPELATELAAGEPPRLWLPSSGTWSGAQLLAFAEGLQTPARVEAWSPAAPGSSEGFVLSRGRDKARLEAEWGVALEPRTGQLFRLGPRSWR